MTHDDDIPELIGRLEPSLSVPEPQAIHAGLSRRKTARKRMAGAAGAFVAALAITGGALALTGDDTTTTETASDATGARDAIDIPDASAPVADDSGPIALQEVTAGPIRTMAMPSVEGLDFEDALLRLFELGLRVTKVEEATSEVEHDVVIRTEPPAGTSIDENSIVTLVTSAGPSQVTVATAPPSFSPQPGAELSGQWTVVELWSDGTRIELDSFPGTIPSIGLDGKSFAGHDGCNSHGNGLFIPSADGSIQIQSGRTTMIGCQESAALTAYSQGALNATQWGLSPSGNLVLANGPVVVVFEQTGPLPQ